MFADTLGLETVPRLIKDSKGDCRPLQRQGARFCPPEADIESMYAFTATVDEARAKQLYDSFPCGAGPAGRFTLCSSQMPSDVERLVIVAVKLKKGLSNKPGKAFSEVAIQFDGDGKSLNNKKASPSIPDDYTQGSDDASQLSQIIAAKNEWTVVGPRRLPRTRIVFMDRWVLFFVPGLAFELEAPQLRVSSLALSPDHIKNGFDVLPGPPGDGWKMLTPEVIGTSPVVPAA